MPLENKQSEPINIQQSGWIRRNADGRTCPVGYIPSYFFRDARFPDSVDIPMCQFIGESKGSESRGRVTPASAEP